MSAFRKAAVYVRDRLAGTLSETDSGYRFAYDGAYLKVLFPFFDGLIPEGWLLHIVSKNWKLDQRDRFGLLLVACRDCIGAVRVEEAVE